MPTKGNPATLAGKPMTSSILAILEPTTLPIARPETPSRTALIEINNSGAEVPNATTVRPIINLEIPNLFETLIAPLRRKSPDKSKTTNPKPATRKL